MSGQNVALSNDNQINIVEIGIPGPMGPLGPENGPMVVESTGYGIISGGQVTAQSTPNMTVAVSAVVTHMPSGVRETPVAVTSLAINAADATNPRIDLIYLAASNAAITYLLGIAAATPVAPTLPSDALGLANVAVAANQATITSSNITDIRNRKSRYQNAGIINVKDFGATGDGVTDDTKNILAAFTNAYITGRSVYFPAGAYRISSALPFLVSFYGQSQASVKIQATSTFSDTMMINFNNSDERKFINNITFDAINKSGLQIFGSGSAGTAGGSSQSLFENLWFINTTAGIYAVGGDSTISESGMLTGSVWIRCTWNGCSQVLNVGQNQDDTIFIGCRFHMDGATPSSYFMSIIGTNCTFLSTYIYINNTNQYISGIKALIQLGIYLVKISGLFIEGTSNCTHIFFAVGSSVNFILENVALNLVSCTPNLIRYGVQSSTTAYDSNITINNIRTISSKFSSLVDLFNGLNTPNNQYLVLTASGVDNGTSNLITLSSGSSTTNYPIALLKGVYQGDSLDCFVTSALVVSGNRNYYNSGQVSVTSANQSAYQYALPSDGIWQISVSSALDGSKDFTATGVFIVHAVNGVAYHTLGTDTLGSIHVPAGNYYGMDTLTVSVPTTANVITITTHWTMTGSHICVYTLNAKKIG
jgi:hypothetical protein